MPDTRDPSADSEPAELFPRFVRPEGLAKVIQVSPRQVYRMIAEGRIPAYRWGRTVRLRADDIDAFLQAGRTTAA